MEEIILALFSSLITSIVAIVILLLLTKVKRFNRNRLVLPYIKIVIILHAVPFVYMGIRLTRLYSIKDRFVYTSIFGLHKLTIKGGYAIICVMLAGGVIAALVRLIQCIRLHRLLRGNVPVDSQRTIQLFSEYSAEQSVKRVRIMQNDLVDTAITTGVYAPTIVLPYGKCQGSDKELRMILAHEFNHIRSRDVLWKYIALVVSVFYWYSPLSYVILNLLDCEQEVECDINTCGKETEFTEDEYFDYLKCVAEEEQSNFVSAFCMTKYDIDKRMVITKMKKNIKKPSIVAVILMALLISFVSSVPVYAAADILVDKYDEQIWNETYSEQQSCQEEGEYVEYTAYIPEDAISEINMFGGATLLSDMINMDDPVPANTRLIFGTEYMSAGDNVTFNLTAGNSTDVFHVGVRNNDSFIYRWVEVTGSILYEFEITEYANYSAFIYNPNSVTINLEGFIVYYN